MSKRLWKFKIIVEMYSVNNFTSKVSYGDKHKTKTVDKIYKKENYMQACRR